MVSIMSKEVKININNFNAIKKALMNAGLTGNKLLLALAQVGHETGGYTNEKIKTHNNASGITFINNPTKQKNATRGNPLPEAPKYAYAKFDTLNDWANDYLRLVGKSLNSSSDPNTYAKKLASQRYYEVSARYPNAVSNYTKGLSYWSNIANKASNIASETGKTIFENKNTIIPIILLSLGLFFIFR